MRRLALLSLCALAVACGGGGDDSGADPTLSGTVGGRAFAVAEVRAVSGSTGASPCSLPLPGGSGSIDLGVTGLKLDFTSYADACDDYASAACQLHANAQTVTVVFAKLNPAGTAPALGSGTFTVYSSPTTAIPDGTGLLTVAYAESLSTGASPDCAGTPSPAVQGGTLRLDQVTGGTFAGAVDLAFQDGSRLSGPFQAPVCPGFTPDICDLATTQSFCTEPAVCNP